MYCLLQLLVYVFTHLVTRGAELSVFVTSSAVLKAPKKYPEYETAKREKCQAELGARPADKTPEPDYRAFIRATMPLIRCSRLRFNQHHVLERVWDERLGVGLGYMAGVAKIATCCHVREHLVVTVHEVRDADHRSS